MQHRHLNIPAEAAAEQHQRGGGGAEQQQDILAAIQEGFQLPPSLEDELEQRLLLNSLLENGENNNRMSELFNWVKYR